MVKLKQTLLLSFVICFCLQLFPQENPIGIRGVVVDETDETLPGVSVVMKHNLSIGTITDYEGKFQLKASEGDVIVFSFVGYNNIEYTVGNSESDLIIRLAESSTELNEVVVVGYGIQKKSLVSSAVSRVTSEDLDRGNPTNVQNAMKGKLSGIQIISESGQPGAGSKIRIRGIGTINDSNPLYVIDGMPSNDINHLNPSDIESIEVLKDAASSAIYGARGANGVILISTKKGTKGDARLSYEFSYGFQNPEKKIGLMNSSEYQLIMNEMAGNMGKDPYFPSTSRIETDWQDILRNDNAPIVNHKATISGGNDQSTYYASLGYIQQAGIFAKDYSNFDRYNARLNYNTILLDTKERNWLNKIVFGTNTNYSHSKRNSSFYNSESGGIISSINMLPPTEALYQTDPQILADYAVTYPNHVIAPNGQVYNIIEMREISNPLANLQVENDLRTINQRFGANLSLDINLLPGIQYKTTYGLDWGFGSYKKVVPVYELNATSKNSNSKVYDQKWESFSWQWENILSYNHSFGLHNVGVMAGTTLYSYLYSGIYAQDYDLLVVDLKKGYINTATAPEERSIVSGDANEHRLASVFSRINYNYDEKYLLEAVIRRDGSSNFSPKRQYAIFPSFSVGWVITRESFMENKPNWLDFAKIRAGWGQNGNENIGAFKYTTMMRKAGNAVEDVKVYTAMLPNGYSNQDLRWETSEQTNIGIDLRFMNSALTLTADYFNKKTKDMLLWFPIPKYTSYSTMLMNAGTVENKGIEFEASYKFQVDKVKMGLSGNASYIKNRVTDQGQDRMGIDYLGGGMGGQVTYSENGRPYGFFYGYVHDGIFQNWNEVNNYTYEKDGKTLLKQPKAQPGDIRFKDLDGKDGINDEDRTMIGDPNPDWTFGFTLTAEWKNFDFSAFFQGTQGNDIFKLYRRPTVAYANWGKEWLNRWHGEGTSNWMPRVVEGDPSGTLNQVSSFYVEDGSYLRLKVMQVGYQLPQQLLKKVYMTNFRVFVQAENLFTFTNYTGYDPEVGTRNGFDGGTYPQARTFTLGANIVF